LVIENQFGNQLESQADRRQKKNPRPADFPQNNRRLAARAGQFK
jgi:hypothetical protein